MRDLAISSLMTLALALIFAGPAQAAKGPFPFKVTSTAFKDGGTIPMTIVYDKMDCTGGNHSPELSWTGAPSGTKSFAVTMYDPDANTGSGFWHWVMFNIPADVTHLAADAGTKDSKDLPKGAVMAQNDFSDSHFDGPCPPPGDAPHHYVITVYALKVDKLPVDDTASGAMVGNYIHKDHNMLGKATLMGNFGRKKQ